MTRPRPAQSSMFTGSAADLPLFSGTPVPVAETAYRPVSAEDLQVTLFDLRPTIAPAYKTRTQYNAKVRRSLIGSGKTPIKATYDDDGNCMVCGEAGRCPGWHTASELAPETNTELRQLIDDEEGE